MQITFAKKLTFEFVLWPIPPLVFLATVVDRAATSAETTLRHLENKNHSGYYDGRSSHLKLLIQFKVTLTRHPGSPQMELGALTLGEARTPMLYLKHMLGVRDLAIM